MKYLVDPGEELVLEVVADELVDTRQLVVDEASEVLPSDDASLAL